LFVFEVTRFQLGSENFYIGKGSLPQFIEIIKTTSFSAICHENICTTG